MSQLKKRKAEVYTVHCTPVPVPLYTVQGGWVQWTKEGKLMEKRRTDDVLHCIRKQKMGYTQ